MRPSAAHAPGLPPDVERRLARAARRQRKAVERSLSRRRGEVVEGDDDE